VRVIEDGELPLDLFLALQHTTNDSVLAHFQEADRIERLQRATGYRDSGAEGNDPRIHNVVAALAAAPGVEPGDRIVRQRLELRRVPVFRLRLDGGEPVFVYGEPPRIIPKNALMSVAGKVARMAPWVVAVVTLVAVALWASSP
jgi:hypothetical protein